MAQFLSKIGEMRNQLNQQVHAQERMAAHYEGRLTEMRESSAAAAAAATSAASTKRSLVDTRGIGKPPVFDSSPAKWPGWAVKMENFVASVFQGGRVAMQWAANAEDAIVTINTREIGAEDAVEINESLYAALAQLTDMEAMEIRREERD